LLERRDSARIGQIPVPNQNFGLLEISFKLFFDFRGTNDDLNWFYNYIGSCYGTSTIYSVYSVGGNASNLYVR
jgi:hypothetical protein